MLDKNGSKQSPRLSGFHCQSHAALNREKSPRELNRRLRDWDDNLLHIEVPSLFISFHRQQGQETELRRAEDPFDISRNLSCVFSPGSNRTRHAFSAVNGASKLPENLVSRCLPRHADVTTSTRTENRMGCCMARRLWNAVRRLAKEPGAATLVSYPAGHFQSEPSRVAGNSMASPGRTWEVCPLS